MKGLWLVALVLLGALAVLPSACSARYRYRMTIDVAAPDGPRRYAAVRQVDATSFGMVPAPNAAGMDRKLTGQAVILDLEGQQPVFATLPDARWPDDIALPDDKASGGSGMDALRARAAIKGVHTLPRSINGADGKPIDLWPTLTQFGNPGNPETARIIDPDALPGGGRISRITIEITDAPVTTGIESRLPWLQNSDRPVTPPPGIAAELTHWHAYTRP